jgi:hypothetical protein
MRATPQRDVHAEGCPAQSTRPANPTRRRLLLALGAGTAGGAAAAAQAIASPLTGDVAQPQPLRGSGYQETEHVRDYYATARI